VKASIRKAASSTLRIFERNGVFDDPRSRDAFAEKGLVDA